MAIFKPFGKDGSFFIAAVIFLGLVIWFICRSFRFFINNFKVIQFAFRIIIRDKSIISTIEKYILYNNPKVAKSYSFISTMAIIFPSWRNIPSLRDIINDFMRYYFKKIMTFVVAYSIYFLFIAFIAKPIMLEEYAGISKLEIYCYPVFFLLHI